MQTIIVCLSMPICVCHRICCHLVSVSQSVCLSVCLSSQAGIVSKRLDESSWFLTQRLFYRAMLCIRGTSHGPVSVRPSVRPSVCLSVCPSQVGVLLKRLNVRSHKQHDSPGTLVYGRQRSPRNSTGSPPAGAPNAGGVGQNRRLSTNGWLYLENGTR